MTDTTASIIEAIVSEAKSDSVSPMPSAPLFSGNQPPIHPLIRCSKQVHAEGSSQRGSVSRFRIPNAIDLGVHIIENIWLDFQISPTLQYQTDISLSDLAGLKAIDKIELRTSENVVLETIQGKDIYTYYRVNLSTTMLSTANALASTSLTAGSVQVPIPLCILKDTKSFPYLSLNNGLELRLYHSQIIIPEILRNSASIWIEGYAVPTESFSLYQNKEYVLPITTIHSQEKVFEKGSIATEETFLLEDPRDLQELLFVLRPDPPNVDSPFEVIGPGNPIYDSLKNAWIEIGTDRVTNPLRSQIIRTVAFIQKHARVPELEEGIHSIPLSNIPQPILYGFSTPGLMSHIQPKVSLKVSFNAINRYPGDRLRFRIQTIMIRGQRLRIQNGKISQVDESYEAPSNLSATKLSDPRSEINVDDPGSLASNRESRPKSVIGYLPQYDNITHEPFSRITRSHALKGSHAFGDLIVAPIPLETDYLSDLVLRVRLPEIPSTYQWINGIGYSLFERITVRHEDTILYDSPGETVFYLDQQDINPETRTRINAINYGYRSPLSPDYDDISQSLYRKTGSPDGYLRIVIPWSFSRKGFPPLPTAALRDRTLEVQFRIRNIGDLVVDHSRLPLSLPQREQLGGLRLTETLLDITGFVLPHKLREDIMTKPQIIRCLQYRTQTFGNPDGTIRVIPIRSGIKRLIMTSPTIPLSSPGETEYNNIQIVQVYSGSTKWYQSVQPPEFFEEWSRWRQGEGMPDIPILCIDNRPGFINAARFQELRIETTPGPLTVLSETEEFYRLQKGKIGPLYAD